MPEFQKLFKLSLLSVFLLTINIQAADFNYTQITDDNYMDSIEGGDMEGNTFVWYKSTESSYDELYYWNGSSTIQLTNGETRAKYAQTSNGNVVWSGFVNDEWGVYYWDGTPGNSPTYLTSGFQTASSAPKISGDKVVFYGQDATDANYNVYQYDGTNLTRITNDQYNTYNVNIDGNNIAWFGDSKIHLYDGINPVSVIHQSYFSSNISVSGSNVAWIDRRSSSAKNHVYLWNGSEVLTISTDFCYQYVRDLSIDGDTVGWVALDENGGDYEIYFYDGIDVTQLTDNTTTEYSMDVTEGYAVWMGPGSTGTDYDLFMYDGLEVIQLMENTLIDSDPLIDGDNIVWRQRISSDEIMFGSVPKAPPVPEPATLILLALGTIAGIIRRKRE